MKRVIKQISWLFILAVLTLSMSMAVQAKSKKNVPTSGKCGKYATWTYDKSTKILKIQGHGKLVSPSKYWPDPWNLLEIKKVEIGDGITKIGKYCFYDMEYLKSVTIPNSVKTIGAYAFDETALRSVTIPKSVKTIGACAFSQTKLRSVTISSHVKNIGPAVFEECRKLKKVVWKAKKIPFQTFHWCTSLSQIKVGSNLQSIGECAFEDTALKKFTMPDSVRDIGKSAFQDCNSLESLKLSSKLKELPKRFIAETESLRELSVPTGVIVIDKEAFSDSYVEKILLPDTVENIKRKAFKDASGLQEIKISNNVTYIRDETFKNCEQLKTVRFGTKVAVIGEAAFSKCKKLANISFPASLKDIEYGAFTNCALDNVVLGSNIRNVDYWAFKNCKYLKSVLIGNHVTTFQSNAVSGCPSLITIQVAADNPVYEAVDNCLLGKAEKELLVVPGGKTGTFVIPNQVRKINGEAFASCSKINAYNAGSNPNYKTLNGMLADQTGTILVACPQGRTGTIAVPSGITTIGASSFQNSKASYIYIPNTVTTLEACAFENCNNITQITSPGSVYQVAIACFWECDNLNKVTIENGVSRVCRSACHGCKKLKKVVLPSTLFFIHTSAFAECDYRLTLYCKKNSLGMSYATNNEFRYKMI